MKTSDFNYELPEELIAQTPLMQRDSCRLMVVNKEKQSIEHKYFRDILHYLRPGDCMVINDTKVLPARLIGERVGTGGRVELLLLKRLSLTRWETLAKPGKKARIGMKISFGEGLLTAEVVAVADEGNRIVEFSFDGVFEDILNTLGEMPLPPYITEKLKDSSMYQTVYARENGSAAAPTAGLHFTEELLQTIEERGVTVARVTLHVGLGTFRPVKAEDVADHHMHSEFYEITEENAAKINAAKRRGAAIVSVGTTSMRTLETVADVDGCVKAGSGWTDIFIYPGYQCRCVDRLITNFHLPQSTLLMLVSALEGKELVMRAYGEAVQERYRFFSFGDAMLLM
ncbi:MAG: tRNA preQ1(34) S-adenosylmethionine ribosyltransferase-isomerase QueA [Lachnospiraceae bacterium]|nr:tRNA preQ1(34) S-adenosylmethionine ribosyltransferase-isomerase QueA [Lachnospiraceae bacterium]MDY5742916.1 tRNA preQ1(34) S-adenosylmethionine ribosyltransferase-isomerase QueA [Lachnospiraceae bacterium]